MGCKPSYTVPPGAVFPETLCGMVPVPKLLVTIYEMGKPRRLRFFELAPKIRVRHGTDNFIIRCTALQKNFDSIKLWLAGSVTGQKLTRTPKKFAYTSKNEYWVCLVFMPEKQKEILQLEVDEDTQKEETALFFKNLY